MCGIVGALDLTGVREFSRGRLLSMTRAIAHRCPDDEHIYIEPGGARRLSIVDLANGRQPIANANKNIWVAFNGELFDYPEIKHELIQRGHKMETNCDTEAWVYLYEDYDEKMFDYARGQYAVSLWDKKNKMLILGRDRVGICPLYYTIVDGWLLWASEIKSLILGMSSRLSKESIPSFTISLNKVGHDERTKSQAAASLSGSNLTALSLNAYQIAHAFPELTLAAEGPMLDTSCSALMQLAALVNHQGYKVVLTGEGADEAFGGCFCFKAQKISETIRHYFGPGLSSMTRKLTQYSIHSKPQREKAVVDKVLLGARPAQQFLFETVGLARESVYSTSMWESLASHNPYEDLEIRNKNINRWHPLNQSLYVGYKVMLPGLLMLSKGDRIAMHSSVEARYPYLDEDVIAFGASIDPSYKLRGFTEKWILRKVASNILPENIAMRSKISFSTKLSSIFFDKNRPEWVDQLLFRESIEKAGYFDPEKVTRERALQVNYPKFLPRHFVIDAVLATVVSTQLWYHLFFGGLCNLPVWKPSPIVE